MTNPKPPEDHIDLSADLDHLVEEEAQLLDMLAYKRGQIATLRGLIARMTALEERKKAHGTNPPVNPPGPAAEPDLPEPAPKPGPAPNHG